MKRVVLTLTAVLFTILTFAQTKQNSVNCYALTLPKQSLSQAEKDVLINLRQEEKLAHDVYYTLYEKWGLPVFNNIAASENRHTYIMKKMLEKYDIDDPVSDNKIGKFASAEYQKLYDSLVTKGNQSLKDALEVGATIEDLDIADIDKDLQKTDNDDIKLALNNLRRGSTHHMRAFVRQLQRLGYTYEPKYISQTEFNQIISQRRPRNRRPQYRQNTN